MKQLLFTFLTLVTFSTFAQTSRTCCPIQLDITITGATLDSLYSDSLMVITPVAGRSIRLSRPPIIRCYHDGTPLIFASGESVKVINEFGDLNGYDGGEMSVFGDPLITPYEGVGQGSFWQSYYMPYNGQNTPAIPHTCTGSVYIWSTIPITGGGPNATIKITLWYDEIPYI